ncbi:uncharacterized protein LOC116288611 [Actinia tenebrosa]|uniref:Uncharacterized protein LOC116288611 n=1 Tax=Actinia tenebrosa TaxID=6105 RepID=A0A6P8HFA0_ACTTE|nr:uncharacterized protein LOC116288611 [Actinia tenebrosa]
MPSAPEFECKAKYLGRLEAYAPKVGTLENAARLYQKGCYDMEKKDSFVVKVSPKCIAIEEKNGLITTYYIKSTLFCATYKKIPKVVVFNYLSTKDPMLIECHALYLDSFSEAQDFVRAVTAAFSKAYSTTTNTEPENNNETNSAKKCLEVNDINKQTPWLGKITDVFGGWHRKKSVRVH